MKRHLLLMVAAFASVALLGGCASSDSPQGKIERALVDYEGKVKSATFVASMTIDAAGLPNSAGPMPALQMSGKIDNSDKSHPRMALKMSAGGATPQAFEIEISLDGKTVYIDLGDEVYSVSNDAFGLDASDFAGLMADASDVLSNHRETGKSEVDGTAVTNYAADIEMENFVKLMERVQKLAGSGAQASLPSGAELKQMLDALRGKPLAQFGIDAEGILRRGGMIMEIVNPIDPDMSIKMVFSGEVHDINQPVKIAVPADATPLRDLQELEKLMAPADTPAPAA